MANLQSRLSELASTFADAVLDAVRTVSLHELQATGRTNGRGPGRAVAAISTTGVARRPRASGRLPRRSSTDIAKELQRVVALVGTNRSGLRAEQIRDRLGMQSRELPRILKEGLSTRTLKSKGRKRATTYFLA
jgi:hypothetical protein